MSTLAVRRYITSPFQTAAEWLQLRSRLSAILHSDAPLRKRYESLRAEFDKLGNSSGLCVSEFDSLNRSSLENREDPFLCVGKDLLTFCDQRYQWEKDEERNLLHHYPELAARG